MHETYESRLATFTGADGVFPFPVERLAEAGFCWTPIRSKPDMVHCEECSVAQADWREDQFPAVLHMHWSPACPLICSFIRNLLESMVREPRKLHTDTSLNMESEEEEKAAGALVQSFNQTQPAPLVDLSPISSPVTQDGNVDFAARHGLQELSFQLGPTPEARDLFTNDREEHTGTNSMVTGAKNKDEHNLEQRANHLTIHTQAAHDVLRKPTTYTWPPTNGSPPPGSLAIFAAPVWMSPMAATDCSDTSIQNVELVPSYAQIPYLAASVERVSRLAGSLYGMPG